MQKPFDNQYYQRVGDLGNFLLFTATCAVTACLLYKLPNESKYDSNWLSNGFCISNQDDPLWNSHNLSFYADTFLAVILGGLYLTRQKQDTKNGIPPLQKALLQGSIMAVFSHGLVHLYLGIDPKGMDLRIHLDNLIHSIVTQLFLVFGFVSLFLGTMPLASKESLFISAILATLGFTIFDVPPQLNFVYSTGVIYVLSAINMLSLPAKHKDTASYFIYPYSQLPVLVMGILESTRCGAILESVGGHAVLDTTIGLSIILGDIIATHIEQTNGKKPKMKNI